MSIAGFKNCDKSWYHCFAVFKDLKLLRLSKFTEAANKIFKKNRLTRARTNDRVANMTDVFNRGIQISDPRMLYSRINKNLLHAKKLPFSDGVKELLLPMSPPNFSSWKPDYSPGSDTVSSFCLPNKMK